MHLDYSLKGCVVYFTACAFQVNSKDQNQDHQDDTENEQNTVEDLMSQLNAL